MVVYTGTTTLMESVENEELFFSLIREIVKVVNPIFGCGGGENMFDDFPDVPKLFADYLEKGKIPYPALFLFFGDNYVKFGKDYLLKTPARIVEQIGNGILIISDYYSDHSKELKGKTNYWVDSNKHLEKILLK